MQQILQFFNLSAILKAKIALPHVDLHIYQICIPLISYSKGTQGSWQWNNKNKNTKYSNLKTFLNTLNKIK